MSIKHPLERGVRTVAAAITVLVTGAAAILYFQWNAPADDHQNANMISMAIAAATASLAVVLLHWASARAGHRWRVPVVTLLVAAGLATIFEYDGVNGELLPQFRYRFAGEPDLATVTPGSPAVVPPGVTPVAAASDSLGLLGSDRNGLIDDRPFAIPNTLGQVETVWRQGIGEGWSSFAVAGDRAVTLEQRGDLECVTCYRLADGELLWNVQYPARHEHPIGGNGPRSTPTIVDDRVYAQGATGRVSCIDLQRGELIWDADLMGLAGWNQTESEASLTWGRSGSPLVVDQLCVVPFGGPDRIADSGRTLIALSAASGEVQWTAGRDQPSYASPDLVTLAGVRQIVSVNEKTITGHRISDGMVLWDFIWPGGSNGAANCAKIVMAGVDRFLVGKGYGGGGALVHVRKQEDGSLTAESVWESTRVLKTKFTHAVVRDGVAYAISNGSLEAVSLEDGRRLWTQPRRSRFGQGQMLIADDTIVAQCEAGEVVLAAVNPQEYQELLRIPALDAKTWNIPTLAGRFLLIRNDREAICMRLPAR